MSPAVFLDRDGVLVADVGLVTRPEELRILPGVPEALGQLQAAGFSLVVISNQAVVARGMATESEVQDLNRFLQRSLEKAGAPKLDGWYFCPHHPNATVAEYRIVCECRKPGPGLLLRAASELSLSLPDSFMVGDRITDVIAGARAGCRTILVETGAHEEPPIETAEALDESIKADWVCPDLSAAVRWILDHKSERGGRAVPPATR